jgi:hypothetical protein
MRRRRGESTGRPADRRAHPATDRPPQDSVRSVEFTPAPPEPRDSTRIAAGTGAAVWACINPRSHAMNTLDDTLDNVTLDNVTGGATVRASSTSTDTITQTLTSLQTTLSQMTNNNQNNQNNYLLPMMMALMMNRRQPTIVSGGATVVGA